MGKQGPWAERKVLGQREARMGGNDGSERDPISP